MATPQYTIVPINCGMLQGADQGNMTAKRGMGEKIQIPTVMFAVMSKSEIVIVDTGPGEPDEVKSAFGRAVVRKDGESPLGALKRLGVSPESVKHVIVTHLHWDHSGGLYLFPNAAIYVQKRELQCAICPPPLQGEIYELASHSKTLPRWLKSLRSMTAIDGDKTLLPGVDLVTLPGHTPGMMGVAINTAVGKYLIASDAVPTRANLKENIPPGWFQNLEDVYRSYDRIRSLVDEERVLMGHDMALFDRSAYPS